MLHLYITILQNNKIRDITDNIYNYIYIYSTCYHSFSYLYN